jgi:hypothetical protein
MGAFVWPFSVDCGAALPALAAPVGWNEGSKTGRSGCKEVALVSSVTKRPGGRFEKYFCLCEFGFS